jgi:hypothetical protein
VRCNSYTPKDKRRSWATWKRSWKRSSSRGRLPLGRDLLYGRPLDAMGRGCLFWLLISVLLSVTLTVVVNLVLFVVSG